MRIGIDVQTLETPERDRGLGRLCQGSLDALAAAGGTHEYVLFGANSAPPDSVRRLLGGGGRFTYARIVVEGSAADHLDRGCAATFLWTTPEARELDLYHVTSPFMFDVLLPALSPCPVAATIADAIPAVMHERGEPMYGDDLWQRYRRRTAVLRQFDYFLPISRASADDAARCFGLDPARMSVIHVPVPDPAATPGFDPDSCAVLDRFRLQSGYVVSVTGFNSRKNIAGTLGAFARMPGRLRDAHPLVLVCRMNDEERRQVEADARRLGVLNNIVITGFVPDADLATLIARAGVMVFPTLYEGFGIPVVEAMALGVPVVTSDCSSLPEVAGDAALLCAPTDEAAIAAAMERVLSDPALHRRLSVSGPSQAALFSPSAHAAKLLDGFARAAAAPRPAVATPPPVAIVGGVTKPRLALFAPFPPCLSGIAEYSERLAVHLAEWFEIECFVDGYEPTGHLLRQRTGVFPHQAFRARHAAHPFKATVYQLGNNALHSYMLPYAWEYPGLAVLHDGSLFGLWRHLAADLGMAGEARRRLSREHPDASPSIIDTPALPADFDPLAFGMVRGIAARSRTTVVHSQWLRRYLTDGTAFDARVGVVPMPVDFAFVSAARPSRDELRRRFGVGPGTFVVASIGLINRFKRLPQALEAFHDFHTAVPDSAFLLMGPANREVLRDLVGYCARHRLKHAVHFLGHRPTSELYDLAAAADVCVNLRHPTLGESSATLAIAMGMGCPAIVTDGGPFLDFPDDVCWKARPGTFERDDILAYLRSLQGQPEVRAMLAGNARAWVAGNGWGAVAAMYKSLLEQCISG